MEAVRTAVLRVKRKRSAEPAEALVLACKRLRSGEVESLAQKTPERLDRAAENNVFQLVATVRSQEEPIQPFVRAALHPSRDSQQRIRRDLRATAGEIRKKGRYRVISARRATGTSGSLECEYASGASEAAGDSGFQLLDLVHEEGDPAEAASADSSKTSDPDVILCNSVELIRERLTISEDRPGVGHQEEQKHDDYVYDIYYLETATPGWIENILSVQPYTQEWELVNDEPPEDTYDDEDDENSENNWRNEYPEEESSDGDEDSRGSDEYDSLSEEERGSRRQVWSKYPLDVQKEFGYDNLQDLDSD